MCSTAPILHPPTMTTQAACHNISRPVEQKPEAEFHPVHMNWVVVSDTNGNRRLQMHWS